MRNTDAAFPYAIPSNSAWISAGLSAFARIVLTDATESLTSAACVSPISCCAAFHSGFHASSGFQDIHVANPSFSQMSFHHRIVKSEEHTSELQSQSNL